jgi:uncharacterized protein
VISTGDAVFLLAAGILAGLVGTAGGITSLVSYPALILVGVPAWPADVANLIAGVACWPGSAMVSRPELRGTASWTRRWAPVSAIGAALGAGLLLATPARLFSGIVPYLVAMGSVVLLMQPQLSAWYEHRRNQRAGHRSGQRANQRDGWLLPGGLVSIGAYNGYFGAGAGVMTLGLLTIAVQPKMAKANALKNMLIGVVSVVSAAIFIAFAPVRWGAVLPLGAGMFVGSMLGPRVARWLPGEVLRWIVGLMGLGLAVRLWVAP